MSSYSPLGTTLWGDPIEPDGVGKLRQKFIYPPFSVLNARDGEWQERKRGWLALGIKSEVSREKAEGAYIKPGWLGKEDRYGKMMTEEISIFDPVLCELTYNWFCPLGGRIVDPFAGGSVRGIVAHKLGYRYWGCDLRAEQIEANRQQADEIVPGCDPAALSWVAGDALDEVPNAPQADLIFTCPPYGDLERYSDDPRDLSTMEYHTFIASYKRCIMRACARLRNNRFAAIVVANFRDRRTGHYRDLVSDTVRAFEEQAAHFYNEIILTSPVGTLALRVTKQFDHSRKVGKTHQNVLVFVKGDARLAAKAINEAGEQCDE